MSLLDDARRLVNGPCPTYWDVEMVGTVGRLGPDQGTVLKCAHCRQKLHEHAPDCPWLSMPKIIAALEAAEQFVDAFDRPLDKSTVNKRFAAFANALEGEEQA